MDLLKKEMEKKKKALALAKQKKAGGDNSPSSRFIRATELRRIEEEQQEEKERKRDEKKRKNRSTEQQNEDSSREKDRDDSNKKRIRTQKEQGILSDTLLKSLQSKSPAEITAQLRSLGLPVKLFGEGEARLNRLHEAIQQEQKSKAGQSEMDEFRLGSGHGIRNPFLDKKESDQKSTALESTSGVAAKADAKPVEELEEEDSDDPHKRVHRFFKGLLREWEDDLAQRPDSVKRTAAGKFETKQVKQCKDYIRPLFKLCKSRRLEPGLMGNILKIIDLLEKDDFVQANAAYMDVSIGRAAWPIGVTMVGIHARSGREKIESSKVPHVMNSELQRKYLTSVKRLMTYYENKRTKLARSS